MCIIVGLEYVKNKVYLGYHKSITSIQLFVLFDENL